jgi:hypothetical protein
MRYAIYADLSRRLTEQERSALAEALDVSVPDSGCVGLQKGPNDEVYFSLEALSEAAARAQAEHYMNTMLQKVALSVEYALTLHEEHVA